jgi:hypothetical protein
MPAARKRTRAALGFSVHTGWAAMVTVSGPPASPAILDRRKLEMIADGSRFAYHAASELAIEPAGRLIRKVTELSLARARQALKAAVADLEKGECEIVASGIIVGNRPLEAPLETILESHSLLHTAEGELYREAIRQASQSAGIPITEVRARELQTRAASSLGLTAPRLADHLDRIGRAAGRPWARDHKDATLAALIALA